MVQPETRRVLLVSTPVGPLGSGRGGGVELTIQNIAGELIRRGYRVRVLAPDGSQLVGIPVTGVPGEVQPYAQYQGRDAPVVMPANSVLGAMWDLAGRLQDEVDLIVNFAYDWLPLYLTGLFRTPVLHLISMGSLNDALDAAAVGVARRYPERLAVHTRAQAATFPAEAAARMRVVSSGLDLRLYPFNDRPEQRLCWVGRIAPEKGLEDALAVAQATGIALDICGTLQDDRYWAAIRREFPDAPIAYRGFLPTAELAAVIGGCRALLMTPKWVEAFGNVAIEALACGTPVIAYRRGGPAEIVDDGRTGWLVEPDSVPGLIDAVGRLDALDRRACREQAERHYSLAALGGRLEQWFDAALAAARQSEQVHAANT